MAKVYLSYSHTDAVVARDLAARLEQSGHDVLFDVNIATAGSAWRETLAEALKVANVFVVLISETSLKSTFVLSEIGAARAYAFESNRVLFVPVIIDPIPVPPVIQDIRAIISHARDVDLIEREIQEAIAAFVGRTLASDERTGELAERISGNSSVFVEGALKTQRRSARLNWWLGLAWHSIGFVALASGAYFVLFHFKYDLSIVITASSWPSFTLNAVRSLLLLGLLGACAKYAFTLGKSHMGESLKCADRIHAIHFGKFYLDAYGDRATWPETKEAFEHWNIDRDSSFKANSVTEFDPRLIETVADILKSALGRIPKGG